MSDPDLIERIARTYYESPLLDGGTPGKWEDAHPEDRAYWRGAVAAIIGAYEADRDRPWPRVVASRIEPAGPGPAVRLTAGVMRFPGYMDMQIDAPIHMALEAANPVAPRIDTLYLSGSILAVVTGRPSHLATTPPWPSSSHFVAKVLVRAGALTISPEDIHTDPNAEFIGHARVNHPTQRDLDRMTGQP